MSYKNRAMWGPDHLALKVSNPEDYQRNGLRITLDDIEDYNFFVLKTIEKK